MQVFEEVDPQLTGRAMEDLLDFSAVEGGSEAYLTPTGGRAAPPTGALSASSVSWVEEMNAELAEFDAVIGRYSGGGPGSGCSSGGPATMEAVDAELEQQLGTPLDAPPPGPPPQPPR